MPLAASLYENQSWGLAWWATLARSIQWIEGKTFLTCPLQCCIQVRANHSRCFWPHMGVKKGWTGFGQLSHKINWQSESVSAVLARVVAIRPCLNSAFLLNLMHLVLVPFYQQLVAKVGVVHQHPCQGPEKSKMSQSSVKIGHVDGTFTSM